MRRGGRAAVVVIGNISDVRFGAWLPIIRAVSAFRRLGAGGGATDGSYGCLFIGFLVGRVRELRSWNRALYIKELGGYVVGGVPLSYGPFDAELRLSDGVAGGLTRVACDWGRHRGRLSGVQKSADRAGTVRSAPLRPVPQPTGLLATVVGAMSRHAGRAHDDNPNTTPHP